MAGSGIEERGRLGAAARNNEIAAGGERAAHDRTCQRRDDARNLGELLPGTIVIDSIVGAWQGAQQSTCVGMGGLREEIAELRHQLGEVRAEVAALRSAPPPGKEATPTPYAQAIQLAKGGGQAGEVATRCGISRGEAELIVALYRKRETS